MANAKYLTYDEFIALALENYCNGGDGYYECLDRRDWERDLETYGKITKKKALEMFKLAKSIDDEYRAAAEYFGGF